ncbi:MAG: hypothetical protein PHG85_05430 [Candidatus Altiarchaeota archaeon]|nr:hypothetical protein [Candidatus Altiarchaeota archaeon]
MAKASVKNNDGLIVRIFRRWPTILTLAIIYAFITSFFGSYMLTQTTTTGGDLGSHWVLAQYLRDYLVPTGRLIGWYPHWMGGLPIFQYYFVPPYFLMVLLDPFIGLQIAFKLVSAAWIFFTPIAFYYGAKALGFERPGPEIAASLSLALTWLETVTGGNYSQWGGNVKSAMAGQFPYGISLAFCVLCIGFLWEGYNSRKRIVLNAVIFSMVVLHHLYTTIFIALASTFFVLHAMKNRKFEGLFYLAKVFTLGFMIAGFWIIPSYYKLGWSSPPRDVFYGLPSMDWVFIQEYTVYYFIIIAGFSLTLIRHYLKRNKLENAILMWLSHLGITLLVIYILNKVIFHSDSAAFYYAMTALLIAAQASYYSKESVVLYCVYTFYLGFFMLYLSQLTNLLYARFIPPMFAIYLLLTTKGLLNLSGLLKEHARMVFPVLFTLMLLLWLAGGVDNIILAMQNPKAFSNEGWYQSLYKSVLAPVITDRSWYQPVLEHVMDFKTGNRYQWYVSHGIKDAPGWLKWNYEGLEVKAAWHGIRPLWNYTSNLPLPGRINYEYFDYGKLATARLFEASPAFTNRSVMESLLVESSTTFPFFYYMQKTVSETSWWPGFPIKIPKVIDLKHEKEIFRVYNVQYYIIYSKTIKALIKNETDYHYLTTIGTPESGYFEIYSVNEDSHYAEVPAREPILVVTDYWRPFSFKWFDVTHLDVPVVFRSEVDDYDLEHFRVIVVNKTVNLDKIKNHPGTVVYSHEQFLEAVNLSRQLDYECGISEFIREELLVVNYTCPGKPLYVKIPYYPNWRTNDADRIYFAAPSLMLIFPTSEHVTMRYAYLPVDAFGTIVTFIALFIVAYAVLLSIHTFRVIVHEPIVARLERIKPIHRLMLMPPKIEKFSSELAKNTLSTVYTHKWSIVMAVALLYVGFYAWSYDNTSSSCANTCTAQGYAGYSVPAFGSVVDNYDMGYNNERENNLRDMKCTAVCDPTRKDFVYVSGGGYVEYSMHVKPFEQNILSIRAVDNQNCRQNDIYIDGAYLGQMFGIGEIGQRTNFEFNIPFTNKSIIKVMVYNNLSKTECYGFDVFSTQVKLPDCACLPSKSPTQTQSLILINIAGAFAGFAAIVLIAYRLTVMNKSLKKKFHDRIQGIVKASVIFKLHVKMRKAILKTISSMVKNKKLAIVAVILIVAAYFSVQYALQYTRLQSMCSLECQDKGFDGGYAPPKSVIDELSLGADNAKQYPAHNLTCTAICDEQRRNYVYVSGGTYIEFDMAVEPGYENTLVITGGNYNELCRENTVYVDGKYIGNIYQPSKAMPESSYELKLPPTDKNRIRVRIDHNMSQTSCWGHDIFKIKTQIPKCVCS